MSKQSTDHFDLLRAIVKSVWVLVVTGAKAVVEGQVDTVVVKNQADAVVAALETELKVISKDIP